MFLIKPGFEIVLLDQCSDLDNIERAGRVCYKSQLSKEIEGKYDFIRQRIKQGHESVLEHSLMIVEFTCDRGVSHELVRHRLCAFSQESTRYCNYKGGVTFVIPPWVNLEPGEYTIDNIPTSFQETTDEIWFYSVFGDASDYDSLLRLGQTPQQARAVLPNSTATKVVMSANLREWRHIFQLRTSKAAHPQMRELMIPLLIEVKSRMPVIFEDIYHAS